MIDKNNENIKKALKYCASNDKMQYWPCSYNHNPEGCLSLSADALELIEYYEKRIEELEDKLSAIEANDYY